MYGGTIFESQMQKLDYFRVCIASLKCTKVSGLLIRENNEPLQIQ